MKQLQAWSRRAGLVLLLSLFLPYETEHDGARFLWQLAPDLRFVSLWTLAAPALCGAVILLAASACRRAAPLALVVIAGIVGLFLVTAVGAEALAWDLVLVPAVWSTGPAPGIFAVTLTATGVCLHADTTERRAAIVMLTFAQACGAAHLLLSVAGESPVRLVPRVLAHVAASGGRHSFVAACVISLLVLWPGLAPLVGWVHITRLSTSSPSRLATLAAYGLPATVLAPALRLLVDPWGRASSGVDLVGGAVLVAAVLVALAGAVLILAEWASERPAAWRWEAATGVVSMTLVALAALATSRTARPADASTAFQLGPGTPEADHLFATLLPRWNDARAAVDLPGRQDAGAGNAALAETELVAAGWAQGDDLGRALAAVVRESAGPALGERRWYTLVERVNEANRARALPYYVDPREVVGADDDTSRRWFRLDAYVIEAVRRFTTRERMLATLHVRALTPERTGRGAMGLQRDVQPFAVVVLDEVRAYREELDQLAAQVPPRCLTGPAADPAAEEAVRACGDALATLAHTHGLGAVLLDVTDRHELQHAIDGPMPARSAWLERHLPLRPSERRAHVQRELSAYLAQMTAPAPAPQLTLVRLLRLALLGRRSVEHDVALLAFEALEGSALELTAPTDMNAAYLRLVQRDDAWLRAGAARAWREIYGSSLAAVETP